MPRKRDATTPKFLFDGFESPNTTPVPDVLFDLLAPELTEAELRVLLYIIRRTYGFKKSADDISLKQLVEGITKHDGTVQDRGAGVAKSAASRAVKGLIEKGIITAQRNRSQEKGDEPTTYRLRFKAQPSIAPASSGETEGPVFSWRTRGGTPREHGRVLQENPQETDTQETDFDRSKFERSHAQIETTDRTPEGSPATATAVRANGMAFRGNEENSTPVSPAPGTASLKDLVARRRQLNGGPRRGGPVGSTEERERLRPFLEDFARELGDEAPLSSTITRVLTIFRSADVAPEQWSEVLYQARGLTQEHTASIRKLATTNGDQLRRKNKMPYFLATLEQLAGVHGAATDTVDRPDRET